MYWLSAPITFGILTALLYILTKKQEGVSSSRLAKTSALMAACAALPLLVVSGLHQMDLAASWFPARKVVAIEPGVALHYE